MFRIARQVVGLDLGSSRTSAVLIGAPNTVTVPSYVAYSMDRNGEQKPIGFGDDAKAMLGRTPPSMAVVRPLQGGAITNFGSASHLIGQVLHATKQRRFPNIKAVVYASVPEAATNVEKRAIRQSLFSAGARRVVLVRKPMAAAIGAGVDIRCPTGSLIVDIGGGTCEISIVSLTDLIASQTLRFGGDAMDQEISAFIKKKFGIVIGEVAAEEAKLEASRLMAALTPGDLSVKGRHCVTGIPCSIRVSAADLLGTMRPLLDAIARAIRSVLEKAPPEIMADILGNQVLLTGGAARLNGLAVQLGSRLKLSVHVVDDPEEAVTRGLAAIMLDQKRYRYVFVNED